MKPKMGSRRDQLFPLKAISNNYNNKENNIKKWKQSQSRVTTSHVFHVAARFHGGGAGCSGVRFHGGGTLSSGSRLQSGEPGTAGTSISRFQSGVGGR